jgi:hypothetical protein
MIMVLKPQDVFVLLKLVAQAPRPWSYASAAHDLFMSVSEVHAGIKRAAAAGLIDLQRAEPIRKNLEEFLVHGVKYAFPAERGGLTRGIPTGYAAPPLNKLISRTDDPPPVWPYQDGNVRGYEFAPLYRSVPKAVASDQHLYELLAIVDAIRDGRARERELAVKALRRRLKRQ